MTPDAGDAAEKLQEEELATDAELEASSAAVRAVRKPVAPTTVASLPSDTPEPNPKTVDSPTPVPTNVKVLKHKTPAEAAKDAARSSKAIAAAAKNRRHRGETSSRVVESDPEDAPTATSKKKERSPASRKNKSKKVHIVYN